MDNKEPTARVEVEFEYKVRLSPPMPMGDAIALLAMTQAQGLEARLIRDDFAGAGGH